MASVQDWIAQGKVLKPTAYLCSEVLRTLSTKAAGDRMVRIDFAKGNKEQSKSLYFNASLLSRLSQPFRTLVFGPFAESRSGNVSLPAEDAHTFSAVHQFAYGRTVDLSKFDSRLVLCAHRWEIQTLFHFSLLYRLNLPVEQQFLDFTVRFRLFRFPTK